MEVSSVLINMRQGQKGELKPDLERSELQQVQAREVLGRSQEGFSPKIHLRCDGNGLPITFVLTAGERHKTVVPGAKRLAVRQSINWPNQ
ncbi:MAG TPA: hypothetical protein V6D20_18180 [Candidatus Obscuribacterales bacterium]